MTDSTTIARLVAQAQLEAAERAVADLRGCSKSGVCITNCQCRQYARAALDAAARALLAETGEGR